MNTTLPGLSPLGNAIATAEGYGVPGAIPTVNNNPGDISSGGSVLSYGSISDGVAALQAQVNAMLDGSSSHYNPSMTIAEVGQTYANGDPAWASNVANYLGVPENTPIGQIPKQGASSLLPNMNGSQSTLSNDAKKALTNAAGKSVEWFLGTPFIMLTVGLILIAAGVFSFRGTQTAIQATTKVVKKGAKLYAKVP